MTVTKIAGALLIVGLVVGVIVGYGVGFITYQPRVSGLQTELAESQSELSKAQSEVESFKKELTEIKAQVSTLTSEVESLREELKGVPILLRRVPCVVLMAVLEYIKENHPDVAEHIFLEPLVYDVEIKMRIGYTTCIFKIYPPPGSERNWVVTIDYPIVPLEKLTYEVHAEYDGTVWEGTIEHITGVVTEVSYKFLPPTPPIIPASEGYIRIYDYKLGYGFEYPEDWETQALNVSLPVEVWLKFTKKEEPTRIEVSIKLTDLKSLTEVKAFGYIDRESILEEGFVEINDRKAYEVIFKQYPDKKAKWVIFLANDREYMIRCYTTEDLYAASEEIFDHVINSFYIK